MTKMQHTYSYNSVDVLTLCWIFCNVFFAPVSQQREHLKYYEDNIKQPKEDFKINKQKKKFPNFYYVFSSLYPIYVEVMLCTNFLFKET